jgi:hypothetical protein
LFNLEPCSNFVQLYTGYRGDLVTELTLVHRIPLLIGSPCWFHGQAKRNKGFVYNL